MKTRVYYYWEDENTELRVLVTTVIYYILA